MKISRLLPLVCASVFVAVPSLAATLPAVGSSAPISLCGEGKAEKSEKGDKEETTDKAKLDNDKKDSKKKVDDKAAA